MCPNASQCLFKTNHERLWSSAALFAYFDKWPNTYLFDPFRHIRIFCALVATEKCTIYCINQDLFFKQCTFFFWMHNPLDLNYVHCMDAGIGAGIFIEFIWTFIWLSFWDNVWDHLVEFFITDDVTLKLTFEFEMTGLGLRSTNKYRQIIAYVTVHIYLFIYLFI